LAELIERCSIRIGTAVAVFKTVESLGFVRTDVEGVGEAVVVVVEGTAGARLAKLIAESRGRQQRLGTGGGSTAQGCKNQDRRGQATKLTSQQKLGLALGTRQ
jgi:hypothetical protein